MWPKLTAKVFLFDWIVYKNVAKAHLEEAELEKKGITHRR
jgi:hypothetical protein